MNDSRDFQDAEPVRSGHSHVTSRPVSFPPHPIPGGMLSRSVGVPSRNDRQAFGTRMVYRETFLQIQLRPLQHPAGIESMEFRNIRTDSFIDSGQE